MTQDKLKNLESRMSMLERKIDMIINLLLSELYEEFSFQSEEEESEVMPEFEQRVAGFKLN